jgi:hypothetical protein
MRQLRHLLTAALTTALLVPAAAGAATIEVDAGGPEEPIYVYRGASGEHNRLTITATRSGLTFVDTGARRIRPREGDANAADCRYRGNRAVCSRLEMAIELGGGNDSVRFRGASIASGHGPRNRTEARRPADLIEPLTLVEPPRLGALAHIDGGPGNDHLEGTRDRDVIRPGSGRDRVDAGAGNDKIQVAPDGKVETLRGGSGLDMVDVVGDSPATIDLGGNTVDTRRETDRLNAVEKAVGTTGDDILIGGRGRDGLSGDGGDDAIRGGGGGDYLAGDQPTRAQGSAGVDRLEGGPGDDLLDGRDVDDEGRTLTPTDELACGSGTDTVIARTDDLVEGCESSAFGRFQQATFFDEIGLDNDSSVAPVARGGDGAPTYAIGCPGKPAQSETRGSPCSGVVQLRRPPVAGQSIDTELLGASAKFTIEAGATANVTVVLNDAGRAALAQPGARASVRVLSGRDFDPAETSRPGDFGWQQRLGP